MNIEIPKKGKIVGNETGEPDFGQSSQSLG